MVNALMSLELGLAMARVSKRELIAYHTKPLYNSAKKLFIDDLFDVKPAKFSRTKMPPAPVNLPAILMNKVVVNGNEVSKGFANGRSTSVDLAAYKKHEAIATNDKYTLGWYSYALDVDDKTYRDVCFYIDENVRPKTKYIVAASAFVKYLEGNNNTINVRLGDKKKHNIDRAGSVEVDSVLMVLMQNFKGNERLVIHTDSESDQDFFAPIVKAFPNVYWLQGEIKRAHPDFDEAEIGLVAALVSGRAQRFIGTLNSTYTAYIQRLRKKNGLDEDFRYLYYQKDPKELQLNGTITQFSSGYEWQRCSHSDSSNFFWSREWARSWPAQTLQAQIVKGFLTDDEMKFFQARKNATLPTTMQVTGDVLKRIAATFGNFCTCMFLPNALTSSSDVQVSNVNANIAFKLDLKNGNLEVVQVTNDFGYKLDFIENKNESVFYFINY